VSFSQSNELGRVPGHQQIGHLRRRLDDDALAAELLGLGLRLAFRQGARGQRAEIALRQRDHRVSLHIPRHHQGGVVGRIPVRVPVARILRGHVLQVIHPADDGAAVGMRLVGGRHQALIHDRLRLVVGTQPALFHHHLDLLGEQLVADDEVGHAVGFQLHRQLQPVFLHLLEIRRVVAAGERVLAPARSGDAPGKLARRHVLRALEHHVLEHVRHPGGAVEFVHRTGPVPYLRHHHRRTTVFLHDHPHAIVQRDVGHPRLGAAHQQRQQHSPHAAHVFPSD
jgi:hypothetical protein